MKKQIALLLTLALSLYALPTQAAKTYRAERFDVHIAVQPDGALSVTETVTFRFEGGPFTYVFRDLAFTELDEIDRLQASLDGQVLPQGTAAGQVEVTAARPLKVTWHFAPTSDATHTFALTYRVQGAIRKLDADTLLWRAVPEDHDYAIGLSTVTLVYPETTALVEAPSLNRDFTAATEGNTIRLTTRDLGEDDDVIVTARFTAGSLIAAAPAWQAEQEARQAAIAGALPVGLLSGIAALVLGGVGLLTLVRRHRRDLNISPVVASAAPPGDTPPGWVGKLTGQPYTFMGTLFSLANRGVLEVREEKGWLGAKRPVLQLASQAQSLRPHERALLEVLFRGRTSLNMTDVGTTLASHQKDFDQPLEEELMQANWLDPERKATKTRLGVLWFVVMLMALGLGLAGVIASGLMLAQNSGLFTLGVSVAGLGAGLFIVSIAGLMYAGTFSVLTPVGEEQSARWKGFQEYLKQASRGREPAIRPDFFELYLPFAAVFGLGTAWAKYFQKLGGVPLPAWFHAAQGSQGNFGAMVAVMSASDSAGAGGGAGGSAGASGGGASGAG